MKITKMNNLKTNHSNIYSTYATFLVRCRKVMGPFDIDKLAHDEVYKAEFFNRVSLTADDKLFELANLISNQLNKESKISH